MLRARSLAELRVLVADVTRQRRTWPRWRGARLTPAAVLPLPAEGEIVVGRSRGCDVVMAQPTVSRHHLELRALDGAWLAVDLGSSNGTWIMGRRVGRARVIPGDELFLGDCPVVLESAGG